jgi:hypothetical protein
MAAMRNALSPLCLFLAACAAIESTPQVVETRPVAPFEAIELSGNADLYVQVGAPLGLTVKGSAAEIQGLSTEVRDGTLYIHWARPVGASWWESTDVSVTVPALAEVRVTDSADARLVGLAGGELRLWQSGSGDVDASGWVDRLEADLSGSGDLHCGQLAARAAKVQLSGSGDAVVRADEEVDVEVTGSGDIDLRGNPAVARQIRYTTSGADKP